MSFADELRKAPEEKKKREELERQRRIEERKNDFNKLIQLTYTYIKDQCKRAALSESTTYNCEFKYKINDIIKSGGEEWWNRTRSRIEHKLNPKSDIITICFTEEDADTFSSSLESKLKGDGLTVNITKKELQNYKMDFVFVKRSEWESLVLRVTATREKRNTPRDTDTDLQMGRGDGGGRTEGPSCPALHRSSLCKGCFWGWMGARGGLCQQS